MQLRVREVCGIGGIPTCRKNAGAWLAARDIPTVIAPSKGGPAHHVNLSDLPDAERLAYLHKQLDELHLDPGTYDEMAHGAYLEATPAVRARAERKAAVARVLVSLVAQGLGWPDRLRLIRKRFPDEAVSTPSLKRILKAVKGVDPINYQTQ